MSNIVLIEPTELYNIVNQQTVYPCLSDPNFILLLDARDKPEYDESHIITAKRAQLEEGSYTVPYDAELECKTHVIVYDGNCRSIRENCPAVLCASVMAKNGSKNPVKILRGGYEDFSAMYPFLRTQKILYMPQEYDSIETFPCEVLPGLLYIGSSTQAQNHQMHKDLKIHAHVNLTKQEDKLFSKDDYEKYLQIPIEDNDTADFRQHMGNIITFIDENRAKYRPILVYSTNGISRSAATCILYLMAYYKWPLKEAWRHMQNCKFTIRPNRGLVRQLSAFEEEYLGKHITKINDPFY